MEDAPNDQPATRPSRAAAVPADGAGDGNGGFMSKEDGGSAFPTTDPILSSTDCLVGTQQVGGMSLRDYFAAHAPTPVDEMSAEEHCAYRYRYADAMIKARAK